MSKSTNTNDIFNVFMAGQSVRQDGRKAIKGIKFVPSGKMYITLDGIKRNDIINIVYASNSVIFRLASDDELELSKADKVIKSHLYKVSGDRHAVSLPKHAINALGITSTLAINAKDIMCEVIDGMTYYQVML